MNPHVSVRGLVIALLASALSTAAVEARPLSLQERIAAQRAIEQVYWNHRIWPKENHGPKPPLSAVLSDAAIRARVEDSLRKSNALEKYWHRPLTAEQLQAELNRMAAQTRDPQVLLELFAALGNDPRVIAETLVRQTLADGRIRTRYADDERFHGALRHRAEAALAACRGPECMPSLGDRYHETTWMLRLSSRVSEDEARPDIVVLEPDEWQSLLTRLARTLGGVPGSLPVSKLGALEETAEGFVVTAVLSQSESGLRTATVIWKKTPFDPWWGPGRGTQDARTETSSHRFTLPAVTAVACVADNWAPTSTGANAPTGRADHTAVWTGAEMIVWGGRDETGFLSNGGRYDPATDTWTPMSPGPAVASAGNTAVWTGAEMIVLGGGGFRADCVCGGQECEFVICGDLIPYESPGGRYNPASDTWMATPTSATVPATYRPTAVWTGTEMILWGGNSESCYFLYETLMSCSYIVVNTGSRYRPSTDTSTPTSTGMNVPWGRVNHTAVWTGTEMIVWGGWNSIVVLNTGGRYDPATDTWTPVSTAGIDPAGRLGHTAVWTGTEMIVWGGLSDLSVSLDTGYRYDPALDTWTITSTDTGVPEPRYITTSVWTGTEMIIWGGTGVSPPPVDTGGRYDPLSDTWTPTSTGPDAPAARFLHTAVWTGRDVIVWGGTDGLSAFMNTGGLYCACPNGALFYRDADGDGYGDPALAGTSCDGLAPPGSVTNDLDCDDTNASVHPGALEVCDGLDDDCDGTVDDAAVPGAVSSDTFSDALTVAWSAVATARTYDVVYGDIGSLRASGGDFTAATQGCLAAHTTGTSANAGAVPAIGSALWIAVRADNCAGTGTYDSGGPGQVGSRDAEIDASPLTCSPAYCGDNVCNGGEDCQTCAFDCGVCP